jgi:hypothetical protein
MTPAILAHALSSSTLQLTSPHAISRILAFKFPGFSSTHTACVLDIKVLALESVKPLAPSHSLFIKVPCDSSPVPSAVTSSGIRTRPVRRKDLPSLSSEATDTCVRHSSSDGPREQPFIPYLPNYYAMSRRYRRKREIRDSRRPTILVVSARSQEQLPNVS